MPLGVVEEQLPTLHDCPLLDRLKAFQVEQGTEPTLQHVFRDQSGNTVNLSPTLPDSDSQSQSQPETGSATLKIREYNSCGLDGVADKIWTQTEVLCPDPAGGVLQAELPEGVTDEAGVYEAQWAVYLPGKTKPAAVSRSVLSVERSLYAPDGSEQLRQNLGPPSLSELRMTLRDATKMNVLLDGHEFGVEELLFCLTRPIRQWNELPPDLPFARYSTRTFPWREAWMKATCGYLYQQAAAYYRRNTQNYTGSGISKSDLDRENEYNAAAQGLLNEWLDWALGTKRSINQRQFFGSA